MMHGSEASVDLTSLLVDSDVPDTVGVRNEMADPAPDIDHMMEYPSFAQIAGFTLDTLFMDGLYSDLERLTRLAATEYTYHDWDSYVEFLDRNLDFHIQLASLSRNDRLVSVLKDLLGSMQRFFYLGLDLGDFASEMRAEHEELVALLSGDDPDEAVACLNRQIASSRDRILRALIEDRIDLPLE